MHRALFLDRDGVINVDHGYVGHPDDFDEVPGVAELMRAAKQAGYLIIVVTNQSGIARGYFNVDEYDTLEKHMRQSFSARGIDLTGVYYCPHHPQGVIREFAIPCSCRKPAPGMILQAAREHDIDLSRSILIGDKPSDIEAAAAAGVGRSFLVGANPEGKGFAEALGALEAP